jgi:hypothetical protein
MSSIDGEGATGDVAHDERVPSLHGYPVDQDILRQAREHSRARHAQRVRRNSAGKTLARSLLSRLRTASRIRGD